MLILIEYFVSGSDSSSNINDEFVKSRFQIKSPELKVIFTLQNKIQNLLFKIRTVLHYKICIASLILLCFYGYLKHDNLSLTMIAVVKRHYNS